MLGGASWSAVAAAVAPGGDAGGVWRGVLGDGANASDDFRPSRAPSAALRWVLLAMLLGATDVLRRRNCRNRDPRVAGGLAGGLAGDSGGFVAVLPCTETHAPISSEFLVQSDPQKAVKRY